jgi:hypothetical protein
MPWRCNRTADPEVDQRAGQEQQVGGLQHSHHSWRVVKRWPLSCPLMLSRWGVQ